MCLTTCGYKKNWVFWPMTGLNGKEVEELRLQHL